MNKIAIVTGAGTGIGKVSALSLAKAGFDVYLVGRRENLLIETKNAGKGTGGELIPFRCDVSKESEVAALFKEVEEKHGRLDLIFNNAGVSAPAVTPEDLPYEDFKRVLDVNLNAVFLCCQFAFRLMKKQKPQGGRIINNGSISAYVPRPFSAPYTASKHAILGLTKSLSLDGREFDICCGQIDIGNAATEMTGKMTGGILQANGEIKPEPRIDSQNVADAVCYMASMPLNTNILTLNVMANRMPFVGRG